MLGLEASIAGVDVDAHYADGRDPLIPAGTLTMATVPLGDRRWHTGATSADYAVVGMARIDPETKEVVAWEAGLSACGWVPDYTWPTIEEAVRAIRTPRIVAKLAQLHRLRRDACEAEMAARTMRKQADALQQEIGEIDTTGSARRTRRARAPRAATVAA